MKSAVKNVLPKIVIEKLIDFREVCFDVFSVKSYSQEGEDLILKRLFENQEKGFYVDVGAHHPKRFSNTYIFYKRGWHGINIDAMPGSMNLFKRIRSRDLNIEIPISDKEENLTYYAFNEPALNGFSKELSEQRDGVGNYYVEFNKDIKTTTLEKVLDDNLSENQIIDFLTIDVEGFDYKVLKSINLDKYRPRVILVEMLGNSLMELADSDIYEFLERYNYVLYAKTVNTVFFIDSGRMK